MSIATATAELFGKIIETIKSTAKEGVEPVVEHDKAVERQLSQLGGKYKLRTTPISMGKGFWSYTIVEIVDSASGVTLGHYKRNYHQLYNTFFPFKQGDKEYALYSKDYTATRVMSLPDCQDIAGEAPHGCGFCPTGFYVPQPEDAIAREWSDAPMPSLDGTFGFICGCVWGDDSSWKIEYLDLSKISEGVLKREARFGYLEMDGAAEELADAIDLDWFSPSNPTVKIKTAIEFDMTRSADICWSNLCHAQYEKQRNVEQPERVQKCATYDCGHVGRDHFRAGKGCGIHACICAGFQPSGEVDPDELD